MIVQDQFFLRYFSEVVNVINLIKCGVDLRTTEDVAFYKKTILGMSKKRCNCFHSTFYGILFVLDY